MVKKVVNVGLLLISLLKIPFAASDTNSHSYDLQDALEERDTMDQYLPLMYKYSDLAKGYGGPGVDFSILKELESINALEEQYAKPGTDCTGKECW